MSDQTTTTAMPAPSPAYEPAPVRPGWKERVVGLRATIAVALATVILGGAGGYALGHVSAGGDTGRGGPGGFRGGPGQQQFPGGPGQQQLPGQQGQPGLPPGQGSAN
jgi:hypothetical protein